MGMVDAPDGGARAGHGRRAAARPGLRAVRPPRAGGRHPGRGRDRRLRLLHRAGARGPRRRRRAGRDRPDDVRGRSARGSTSRTATRPASSAGPASATASSPTRPPGGRSCSSATARSIATPRVTPTWSSPSGRSCRICVANRLAVPALDGVRRDRPLAGGDDRRLAADPDSARRARPAARPFFCGPEVWGPGLFDPPEPA